ncbi:MAG: flavodoxin family protein [Nanoarchaeota archaeon]
MKILVVYYSRTGNTKLVAEQIAKLLNADLDEIIDEKDRKRKVIGWVISGYDALKKELTKINHKENPKNYNLVIIGTPNWAGTMTPAIRTYLTKNKLKNVAFFCTFGGNEGHVFQDMESLSAKPKYVLGLRDKKITPEESMRRIKKFCEKIK